MVKYIAPNPTKPRKMTKAVPPTTTLPPSPKPKAKPKPKAVTLPNYKPNSKPKSEILPLPKNTRRKTITPMKAKKGY